MKLLVGLGNPGAQYETTKHNAGFIVLDELVDRKGLTWAGEKFRGIYGAGQLFGERCVFLKPSTYMNLSGRSVQAISSFYKIPLEDLIVIYDDIDMPAGKVKLKMGGGHGGHNGIRSIVQETGFKDFNRIKLGVGRPENGMSVSDWVLSRMDDEFIQRLQSDMCTEVEERLSSIF